MSKFLVIAVNQHITYEEHLPLLLGTKAIKLVKEHTGEELAGINEAVGFQLWLPIMYKMS